MTNTQARLTSALFKTGGWIKLEHTDTGWSLTITHRHEGGLMSDCQTFFGENLSWGEVLDVIDAEMSSVDSCAGALLA